MPPRAWISYRSVRALALLLSPLPVVGCAARNAALHCADGALPCADQIAAIHCETLTDGTIPPDLGEVRWMFDGARVPQRGEPQLSITSWCSGTLEVDAGGPAKTQMQIELYQAVEGGHLRVPGRDRVWFEAPPEERETKEKRFCVDEPLPLDALRTMKCRPAAGATGIGSDEAIRDWALRAQRVDADKFGPIDGNRMKAWCEGSGADPAKPVRIDLFQDGRAWIHLPGERRLCFM